LRALAICFSFSFTLCLLEKRGATPRKGYVLDQAYKALNAPSKHGAAPLNVLYANIELYCKHKIQLRIKIF
jgi:hypothetical protein